MFYISFDGEVVTQDMLKTSQRLGKMILVPVCRKNGVMKPCILEDKMPLARNCYGILEPVRKKFMKIKDLDLVIVPGVAFDKKGRRIGRGKGYYDRFLKKLSPNTTSIGLAFDFQILPSIPATRSDVGVDKVIFA